jgi:Protein of unknown function (DUF1015)
MAHIAPFRALRYDPARVDLSKVVTEPYDKITPEMQERYYAASPHNLVEAGSGGSCGKEHLHSGGSLLSGLAAARDFSPGCAAFDLQLYGAFHGPRRKQGIRAAGIHCIGTVGRLLR